MKIVVKTALLILIVFSSSICRSQETETTALISNLIGDTTIELPEAYTFEKSIQLKVISQRQGTKSSNLQYLLRFPQSGEYMAVIPMVRKDDRSKRSELLIDFDQMQMISFLDASDANMAVIRPIEANMVTSREDIKSKFGTLSKTGREKKIAGHLSQEYTFESPKESGSLWIAQGLKIDLFHSFDALGLGASPDGVSMGTIMAIKSVDKETNMTTTSQIEQLDLSDSFTINTEGYIPTRLPEAMEEK